MRRTILTVVVGALILCVLVAAWALVRHRRSPSPPHVSTLPQVVSDLQFVEDGLLSDPIHAHDKQLPLPARFETGHRYIFHNIYGPHDLIFYKQLLERFGANGFDTRGSFSADDPGQPWPTQDRDVIFRIVFRDASYSGYLERRLDLSFPKSDGFADYVLAIESAH